MSGLAVYGPFSFILKICGKKYLENYAEFIEASETQFRWAWLVGRYRFDWLRSDSRLGDHASNDGQSNLQR